MKRFKKKSNKVNTRNAGKNFIKEGIKLMVDAGHEFDGYCYANKKLLTERAKKYHKAVYHLKNGERCVGCSKETKILKFGLAICEQMEAMSIIASMWDSNTSNIDDIVDGENAMYNDTYKKIIGIRPTSTGDGDFERAVEFLGK